MEGAGCLSQVRRAHETGLRAGDALGLGSAGGVSTIADRQAEQRASAYSACSAVFGVFRVFSGFDTNTAPRAVPPDDGSDIKQAMEEVCSLKMGNGMLVA